MVSLGLLIQLYYQAITDTLGADPVENVLHFTGIGAFNLLVLSLLITPVVKRFKLSYLLKLRRLFGLYSFAYALFHVVSFIAFEVQFDWSLFISEIVKRPYITVGMAAFIILLLLAITSISVIKRRMGRHWQLLHNWVYGAILLTSLHFYWSVKSDIVEPVLYATVSGLLLYFRKESLMRRLRSRNK